MIHRSARLAAVAAGVWLLFSPAVLGYDGAAADSDRIVGPIAATLAFVALWEVLEALRWGTLPAGIWLLAAPLVLGYDETAATVSSMAAGAVLAVTAVVGGHGARNFDGGWLPLLRPSTWRADDEGRTDGRSPA